MSAKMGANGILIQVHRRRHREDGEIRCDRSPHPNAILVTFPNLPDPLEFLGGADVISLLYAYGLKDYYMHMFIIIIIIIRISLLYAYSLKASDIPN